MSGLIYAMATFAIIMIAWLVMKRPTIWWKALLIALIASCIVEGLYYVERGLVVNSRTADEQLLHGMVTDKQRVQQDCPYGWNDWQSRFCTEYHTRRVLDYCTTVTTGSGKSRSSHIQCYYKTQYHYDYPYEVKWYVNTTLHRFKINRVNPQGTVEPERWKEVKKHDPVTTEDAYTNYLLLPSLFTYTDPKTGYKTPKEPTVSDYYNTDLVANLTKADVSNWNFAIRKWLDTHGHDKQVSVSVVITDKGQDFFDQLMYDRRGTRKNEVTMVFGVDPQDPQKILWFNAATVAKNYKNSALIADLKMQALSQGKLGDIHPYLTLINKDFHRYPMHRWQNLKEQVDIPWYIAVFNVILFSIIGSALIFRIERFITASNYHSLYSRF